MHKLYKYLLLFTCHLLLFILSPQVLNSHVYAAEKFINIVMPVRGDDFWSDKNISPDKSFQNYFDQISQRDLSATYLLRFDSLYKEQIVNSLKNGGDFEVGMFLEVTPKIAKEAGVNYHESSNWHNVESVLLTGYEVEERQKLIDKSFEKFRQTFGSYPKSVGAWWIDGGSLKYMQEKYKITSNLTVSDQFSTDGYQVWGLFWSQPFYPSSLNASQPAQSLETKAGVLSVQWAARDPYNGYGERVEDSTYSVQGNDYLLHPNLDINYFSKLLDIYLNDPQNQFGQIVVGIENDFTQKEYQDEFFRQLDEVARRKNTEQTKVVKLSDFASWYSTRFPQLSAPRIILSQDPLNEQNQVFWYSNNFYRTGLFSNSEGLFLRDLRLYNDRMEEPCLRKSCKDLDLAHTTAKQLDDITNKQRVLLEEGNVKNLRVNFANDRVELTYQNFLDATERIVFLRNDIVLEDKPYALQNYIIENTKAEDNKKLIAPENISAWPALNLLDVIKSIVFFKLGVLLFILLPGRFLLRLAIKDLNLLSEITLSTVLGLCVLIVLSYILYLINLPILIWPISAVFAILTLRESLPKINNINLSPLILISSLVGITISILPVIKNGLNYSYGLGFWGANGHDAIWHLSLIESIKQGIPVQNFLFSQTQLVNYHYFFDLILASLSANLGINTSFLYFQLWPIFISNLLVFLLIIFAKKLNLQTLATSFLILIFFLGGSFGWVISYFRNGDLGGESMFWANQAISLHINPPFALSIAMLLGGLIFIGHALQSKQKLLVFYTAIVFGLLWGIKAYAGVLTLAALGTSGFLLLVFRKDIKSLGIFVFSLIATAIAVIPNTKLSQGLFKFEPFWLVSSMIDSIDRLGWEKLSSARFVYTQEGNYPKLFLANTLGLLIFIVGNLGVRILGFGLILRRKVWNAEILILLFIALYGLLAAVLFTQKGTPWNIVQFFYYTMFAFTIFSAIAFDGIIKKLPRIASFILVALLVVLGSLTTYSSLQHYLPPRPPAYLSEEEFEALNFLKLQENGTVLTVPFDLKVKEKFAAPVPLFAYVSNAYISAYSAKPSYVSDEVNLEILDVDYKKRIVESKEYFKNPNTPWAKQFLKDANIKYLYLLKDQFVSDPEGLEKIYENGKVNIFKVPINKLQTIEY